MSTFPLWVYNSFGSSSCASKMATTLLFNALWSLTLIIVFVISWQIAHLSSHILCNATMQRTLNLHSQASFLCFLNTQVLNDFGNTPCQRFLLPNISRSRFTIGGMSGNGVNYGCNIDSSSKRGATSSSVNIITSCCRCTNRSILKFIKKSCLQSITCSVSNSGLIKQHL